MSVAIAMATAIIVSQDPSHGHSHGHSQDPSHGHSHGHGYSHGHSDGNSDGVQEYQLTELNSKNWLRSDKTYTLSNGSNPILFIDFSYKKWKEHISLRFTGEENYPLLMCSMFIIRSKQNSQAAGSVGFAG